jgi:hypothetical protein
MEKPLRVLPCFDLKGFAFFSLLTQLQNIVGNWKGEARTCRFAKWHNYLGVGEGGEREFGSG